MKCITYVSKVRASKNGITIPRGLSQIFSVARKKNSELGITGILSYRRGYYIQVLEGEARAVDRLFSSIESDMRHENVTVIFDGVIAKRSFPLWSMRLLQSAGKDPYFCKFVNAYSEKFEALPSVKRALLGYFYDLKAESDVVAQGFETKELKLLAWPDFTVVKQSPVIIELCARLTKRPYLYSDLIDSGDFGTQQQLDKILNKFNSLEILNISEPISQKMPEVYANEPNNFYSRMKDFLRFK